MLELASEACLKALSDAGLPAEAVSGLGCFHENDSVSPEEVASTLGLGPLSWSLEWLGGGFAACEAVAMAARAIAAGSTEHVIVYRAMNGASGIRMGSSGTHQPAQGREQFTIPYGLLTPAQRYAIPCRRHMYEFGTRSEQLGAIAVTQRRHAGLNPAATMYGKPMTLDDYMNSRMIVDPYRLFDCCQETDGAVALVLSRDTSASSVHRPVFIASTGYAMAPYPVAPMEKYADWTVMFPHWLASRLFADAGLRREDIHLAILYDAYTFTVLCQLEDFGFCAKGEGGAYVESGAIALGGELPVNTNGGMLSEGHIHGLNGIAEAVTQLRHDAGARQVADARHALVSGYSFSRGSALILAS